MVKDHIDSERGNPLPSLYGLLLDTGIDRQTDRQMVRQIDQRDRVRLR